MFDFRYHVVSLAAVFLALVVGILVGVGISGRGVLGEAERAALNANIAELRRQLDAAQERTGDQRAAEEFVAVAYDAVMRDRLAGRAIALVFVGAVQAGVHGAVVDAITEAGGRPVRMRSLAVPVDPERVDAAVRGDEELEELSGEENLERLGRRLGEELVAGGETPLWDALSAVLVIEVSGPNLPADGVVVARTAGEGADEEATARLLDGLYAGLAATVPAVAVETTGRVPSVVDGFRRTNLSSVDNVDRDVGKVALAVLLAGGPVGHYGVREGAVLLPPVDPVERPDDE
jgi:hypothetical protein